MKAKELDCMADHESLAERFEENRGHLRAVAYRMLGSLSEADDAIQETWLRLSRSDSNAIENLRGWLTTVIARICLDMLRSRTSRREESLEERTPRPIREPSVWADPEQAALLADSVGLALLVILDRLSACRTDRICTAGHVRGVVRGHRHHRRSFSDCGEA